MSHKQFCVKNKNGNLEATDRAYIGFDDGGKPKYKKIK